MGHKLVKIHFVRLQCFLSVVEDPRGHSTITNANHGRVILRIQVKVLISPEEELANAVRKFGKL